MTGSQLYFDLSSEEEDRTFDESLISMESSLDSITSLEIRLNTQAEYEKAKGFS